MGYKKIEKEYCITDNTVNVYGYRMLSEGMELERYKPPIGYLMHNRDLGVAVRWEDFRREGDKIYAKPVVNTTAFPALAQQIEDGFYDAASCGRIVALEWSEAPELKIAGQTGITVTRWFPRDISIVDIPGNYNALANLFDESDNILMDLSDQKQLINKHQKQNNMSVLNLTAEHIKLLDLADTATPEQVTVKINDLIDKAKRTEAAEKALADLQAGYTAKEVDALLERGMSERKLTKQLSDQLRESYQSNPEGLKALIDAMPAQQLVGGKEADELPEKYRGKSFEDLYLSGDLADVKTNYPDYYKTLKK